MDSHPRNPTGQAPTSLPEDLVREHVSHILRSSGFAKSERLKRFLAHAVERTLSGRTDSLKEYSIALEVFDRKPDYNPKVDAVVRVEARRLRSRLEDYYANDGVNEPVRIQIPSGAYVPVIERHEPLKMADPAPATSRTRAGAKWLFAVGAAVLMVALIAPRL